MKIKGKSIPAPLPVQIPILREDELIVFTCKPVLNYAEFDKLCPEPEIPMMLKRGESNPVPDPTDKQYKAATAKWAERKMAWLIITSLSATEGMAWEKVNVNHPDTWELYTEELADSQFTQAEINQLVGGVFEANSLSDKRHKEAMERFSRLQAETPKA